MPGVALLFGGIWLYPDTKEYLFTKEVTVGTFGIFVIAAYLAGHLIQAVGNLLETACWIFTGKPTHWVTWKEPPFLSRAQRSDFTDVIEKVTGSRIAERRILKRKDTNALRGQLYARIKKEGRTERIDIFNGSYGMFRGIAAAGLVVALIGLRAAGWDWKSPKFFVPLVIGIISGYRCYRFGVHYASELYWQVFDSACSPKTTTSEK